jgi:hypothetical protein
MDLAEIPVPEHKIGTFIYGVSIDPRFVLGYESGKKVEALTPLTARVQRVRIDGYMLSLGMIRYVAGGQEYPADRVFTDHDAAVECARVAAAVTFQEQTP